jgi:hypothetical protein
MTAAAAPAPPTALQTRASAELSERLGGCTERLGWDADRLATHQQQRLRALLAHAAERFPLSIAAAWVNWMPPTSSSATWPGCRL